jgi:hypothetical protein
VEEKKATLHAVLAKSWAWLHVDGTAPGVDLPEWLRMPWVRLQIGYDMPLPIPDLAVDDAGVRATLSFRRVPHACVLPWASIFAISDVDLRGVVYSGDVPSLVREFVEADLRFEPLPPPQPDKATDAAPPVDRMRSGRPRPSHLKLV